MRNLPRDVDERIRVAPLTLPAIRAAIPQHCFAPRPARAWGELARILVSAIVCLTLLANVPLETGPSLVWQIPALAVLWILYGWVLVGAFLVGHDCGHGSFSKRAWINNLIGWFCLTPLANSFHVWRITHKRHHAFTQLRGQDVDWACYLVTREEFLAGRGKPRPLSSLATSKLDSLRQVSGGQGYEAPSRCSFMTRVGYALPCGIFLWIAWNTLRRGFMTHRMFQSGSLARHRRVLVRSNAAMAAGLVCLYGGLWYWCGFWGMLKYHGVPATIAMATSWIIITIQHANDHGLWYEPEGWTPVRGQLVSTFDIRFPRWLEYVWCFGNIHIPHHVAPTIPWYNLKEAGRAIQQAFPSYYQELPFTRSHLSWLWKTPFLERVDEKRYYVLESAGAR